MTEQTTARCAIVGLLAVNPRRLRSALLAQEAEGAGGHLIDSLHGEHERPPRDGTSSALCAARQRSIRSVVRPYF